MPTDHVRGLKAHGSSPAMTSDGGDSDWLDTALVGRRAAALLSSADFWCFAAGSVLAGIAADFAGADLSFVSLRPPSVRRQRLSVRSCPASACRTGPRRRCRNSLLDCGPLRSCTRHRGYIPRRSGPTEDPAPSGPRLAGSA